MREAFTRPLFVRGNPSDRGKNGPAEGDHTRAEGSPSLTCSGNERKHLGEGRPHPREAGQLPLLGRIRLKLGKVEVEKDGRAGPPYCHHRIK